MNHVGTEILETERLLLRKISIDDAEAMYNTWATNLNVARYTVWQTHKNVEETKELLKMWENEYKNKDCYRWCIILKDSNKPIGTIDVVYSNDDRSTAEIGYCIAEECWGCGITTEAAKKVISFLFNKVGYNRIQAKHFLENPASGKVMKKIGMQYEGVLREYIKDNTGNYKDVAMYSILKKEFKEE